ncbi:hypothetical protein BZB76_0660 [Actinomadura pelletieri DSM 43383]|uniref:Uncharacterized protein n=1 Tax=Actinomadura pelletieri DSM 43383 TaxID=1120940 RepID=A0A495QYE6_9ACTN|nr:hypothetical protein [Actinomadura pelletieri]RKS79211.1 hypothetical protein BZB76_0660 [Actinomadura pelletieri DSM 43383]
MSVRPSFDPAVTAEDRVLLEARPDLLHPAAGVRSSGPLGGRAPRDVLFSLWNAPLWAVLPLVIAPFYGRKAAVAGAVGQVAAGAVLVLAPGGVFVLMGATVVAFGVLLARCGQGQVGTLARRLHGSYVVPGDLDAATSALLGRVQRAIRTVLTAEVTKEGLLDDLRNAVMLPAQEWEIAQTLREISRLSEEQRTARQAGHNADLAQVMGPQAKALKLATASVTERVEAIERYAEQVRAADRALLQWRTLQRLADNNDAYGELLARTVRDELAIAEIDGLTEEAKQVEEALRRSVEKARRTGLTLLPGGLAEAG